MARASDQTKGCRKSDAPPGAPAASDGETVLAVFAHDIRTALTGILALGELLASSNLGERERRWATGIKDSAEHLASLTTLVIDAAKADAGSLTLQQEIFRPRRLIAAISETLAARAETKNLRAEVTVADDRAGMSGRRSGAAARGAGEPRRQCGEVHRAGHGAARRESGPRRGRTHKADLHCQRQRHRP